MKLIFKYLKPYILTVLVIIGFTFLQVQTELALPDYMSDIVTNGIQYGGITENVPSVIMDNDMEELLCFMSEADRDYVLGKYDLLKTGETVKVNDKEYELLYDSYVLNEGEDTKLKEIFVKPMVYAYSLKEVNLLVTEDNAAEVMKSLDEQLVGLEDNYTSMGKLYIQSVYGDAGIAIDEIQSGYIFKSGIKMLGVSFLSGMLALVSTYLAIKTATGVAATMRKDVFEKVESFSSSEFSTFSTSSLITRTGNDVTKIQNLVQMMLRMMLMAPLMGITAIFKVAKYPQVSWILLVAIGIMLATMGFLLMVAFPKFEKIQKLVDKINNIMREYMDGMLVIRAFNSEKIEEEKFDKTNKEQTAIDRFVSRCMGIIGPVMTIIMNLLTVFIVYISAYQIDIDAMTIGDTMAFIQYAMHVVMSFMFVTMTFFMIPRSLVSAKRIRQVLDTENTINDIERPEVLPEENGDLVFDHVCFKYPGAEENILEDVCFTAKPGETVAMIGSTACGKSTIIKLIPRLFDVTEGKITYCGHDIRNVAQKQLHEKIGYATQKAILFTGTIESNIKFGRDVNDEEFNEAIDISQSRNIINEKEDGINDKITQGGTNVSGGQKQRLSIARALAKKANIYIFDDSFSALDYATDKKLRAELNELIAKTKATVFIVAQRIATIKNADKILVIEDGKIVGEGTHRELLENCKVYQEIAYSQLSKEELENARA